MKATSKGNQEILEAFKGLRVADVRDGMDWCGMMHYGTVSSNIKPLFSVLKIGIARTARYLPFQGPMPFLTGEEYTEWSKNYYEKICTFSIIENTEQGDFLCLDQSGMDVGLIGSCSGLIGIQKGAVGWLSNGGVRDTDEMILEKVPFWGTVHSQPMVQGRMIFDAEQVPIQIGGVVVYPGDVVVADGDGAVIVPRRLALDVARYARQELDNDKKYRKKVYIEMGMELDDTVV